MGKPPAVVIIARHGARLDAADKHWVLTSPTPYDPPLTYGGWLQARALGARIAGILQTREDTIPVQPKAATTTNGTENGEHTESEEHPKPPGRKRHKIIIHSSPFVRCLQTSIAISAGIGQFRRSPASAVIKHAHHIPQSIPRLKTSDGSPHLSANAEPEEQIPSSSTLLPMRYAPPTKHRISQLRVDAFLGEWLSPDYFDQIIPPPSSVMMVAGAKADLLRPGENIEGSERIHPLAQGNFPGGWKADWSPASSVDEEEKAALSNLPSLGHSLPNRHRAATASDPTFGSKIPRSAVKLPPTTQSESLSYIPPTPTYAISSSEPIPTGYVAHARDACVDVKYQWDSMRPPMEWGNGGDYGEEWSSMHKRFRNGLQKMIAWYEENGTSLVKKDDQLVEEEEDSDEDTVLILVTHGAGCNALIGALTNQPVLLDVGMASLTMAIRKENVGDVKPTPIPAPRKSRRGSIDLGIANEYDMKIISSTEHLRAASTPLTHSPRLGSVSSSPHRRPPLSTQGSFTEAFNLGEITFGRPLTSVALHQNAAIDHHRSATGPTGLRPSMLNSAPRVSSGLWRIGTNDSIDEASDSGRSDTMPNFGRENSVSSVSAATESAIAVETGKTTGTANGRGYDHDNDHRHAASWTTTRQGLWQPASFATERENASSQRRWTVVEEM